MDLHRVAKRGSSTRLPPRTTRKPRRVENSAGRVAVLFFFYAGCSALCFLAGRNTCTLLDHLWPLTPRTPTEDAEAQDGTELNLLHEEIVQLGRDLQEALLLQRERQVELPAQEEEQQDGRPQAEVVVGVLTKGEHLDQLEELLTALKHPQVAVLVHLDASATVPQRQRLPGLLTRLKSMPDSFASIEQLPHSTECPDLSLMAVDATLRTIEEFVATVQGWKFYLNLSSQDLPLIRPEELLSLLQTAPPDANFLDIHFETHFDLIFERVTRLVVDQGTSRSDSRSLPTYPDRPFQRMFPTLFDPYYGSGGAILSAPFARYLATTNDGFPRRLFAYYTNVQLPAEGYFQTLLCASEFDGALAPDHLRVTGTNMSAVDLHVITTSGALFATGVTDPQTRRLLIRMPDRTASMPTSTLAYAQARFRSALAGNQTCGNLVRGSEELRARVSKARQWKPDLTP